MKKIFIALSVIILALGCARVSVQGSKEPIKLDISMRLDIYQHVQKDIDSIENIVSGAPKEKKPGDQGFLSLFIGKAYAQEALSSDVEQAALRRKDRLAQLKDFEAKGAIGENKLGLVEFRGPSQDDALVMDLVSAENKDRMIIYNALAAKNNTPVEEIQKIYSMRLQGDAPAGTPLEAQNPASGAFEWRAK